MKARLFLLFSLVLLWFTAVKAQPITTPEAGTEYFITHSSGLFLSSDGGTLKIMSPGAVTAQRFLFEAVDGVEGAYNIKLVETGEYLWSDGYTLKWTADPASLSDPTLAQYTLSVAENDSRYIAIACVGKDAGWNCLGADGNNDGDGVYADKSGKDGKYNWNLQVATDDVVTSALENAIANAEETLASVEIGNEPGQYPQSAADVLTAAINAAKSVLANPTDQSTVNDAVTTLNEAVNVFNNSMNSITVDPEKEYWIVQVSSGLVMDVGGTEFVINTPTGVATQHYKFVPIEGEPNVYNIQISDGSGYFAWTGGWNSVVSSDPAADDAKWVIELQNAETLEVSFNRHARNGHIGTDSTEPGSSVYTNKGTGGNGNWVVIEVVEGGMLTYALETSIANAQELVAGAEVGEETWQYPQSAVDALNAAIAAAQQALTSATTQEEINTAWTTLTTAIAAFEDGWNKPVFAPAADELYRFSVAKYSTNYMTVSGESIATAEYTAGDANQHWSFEAAGNGAYYVMNNGKALAYDFTLVDKASAPTWKMVYTTTSGVDMFSLVEADDETKVLTFSSGKTPAIQDFVPTNNAHQGRFTKVDMPNDPDRTALENAIGSARTTLRNIDRGNEIGQWSDAKCDAFEAVIEEAEALTGATQEQVDEMTEKLNDARTEFVNNPNQVIKDDLEGMLASAQEILDEAVVGIEVGEWYQSAIDEAKAKLADYQEKADNVSEQEDADALTEEVGEWVDTLTGNAEQQDINDVFADAVECARALYEAEKENVGYDKGQRPQAAVDAFDAAITAAEGNAEPTVEDLNTLQAARATFIDSVITVDRAALKTAVEKAQGEEYENLVAGEFDGNYPQEAIDAFNEALEAAQEALTDLELTQEEVDEITSALNSAMTTLTASKVVINFATLDERIALANSLIETVTVIGDGEGECPQSVVDALQSVVTGAEEIDRAAVSQATVDDLVTSINAAIETFRAALVESTGLAALIDEAQALHDGAEQGLKPGNYPSTACTQLQNAIDAATEVLSSETSTQADLLASVETLKAAMETFEAAVIPAHDLTELEALIAECEAFIAEYSSNSILDEALADAKAVVENPDDYTASEVKDVTETLEEALEYSEKLVGVAGIELSQLTVTSNGGVLRVAGLEGEATVNVYSMNGTLVGTAVTVENEYTFDLVPGTYVLTVVDNNCNGSRVVIVK